MFVPIGNRIPDHPGIAVTEEKRVLLSFHCWAFRSKMNHAFFWHFWTVQDEVITLVMRRITTFRSTTDRIYDGGKDLLENPDKLIVEENYLQEEIFNVDETSIFWKRMSERTFIHKRAKSMPGFKVCISTLYNVRTTTKSPNDAFPRKYPRRYATQDRTLKCQEPLPSDTTRCPKIREPSTTPP